MKVTLSLPAALRQAVDAAANDIGVSRVRLLQIALEDFLRECREKALAGPGAGLREESEAWPTHNRERLHRLERQEQGRKIALSLPKGLIEAATAAAKDLRISRSKLFQAALESLLRQGRERAVKMAIERYVAEQGKLTEEDQILLEHARQMTRRVEWNE